MKQKITNPNAYTNTVASLIAYQGIKDRRADRRKADRELGTTKPLHVRAEPLPFARPRREDRLVVLKPNEVCKPAKGTRLIDSTDLTEELAQRARQWAPTKAIAWCLRSPIPQTPGALLKGRLTEQGDQINAWSGLKTCDNSHVCVNCALRISRTREAQLTSIAKQHADTHGLDTLELLTLTVRHDRSSDLRDLLDAIQRANRAVWVNRDVKRLLASFAHQGYVYALEVTYTTANSWHPHRHYLMFFNKPLRPAMRKALNAAIESAWIAAIAKVLPTAPLPGVAADLKNINLTNVTYIAKMSTYLTKLDTGHEAGHSKSRSPFDLLADGRRDLWVEYADAMKGRRAYVASKGLLDAANNREIWNMSLAEVLEYEAEKTSSTLPDPPVVHHTLLVGPQVLRYATQHYEVRRALESACWSGYEAVGDWLEMFIVETGIETDGEFEYVLGDEDQLSINWEPEPYPDQPSLESQPEQTEPQTRSRAYRDEWINPQRLPEF